MHDFAQASTSHVANIQDSPPHTAAPDDTIAGDITDQDERWDLMDGPNEVNLSVRSSRVGEDSVTNILTWNVLGAKVPVRQPYHVVVEGLVKFTMLLRAMAHNGLPA